MRNEPIYLTARQLRERWGGRSHMFIERLLQNDPSFPKPIRLGGKMRFWRLDEIEAWEAQTEEVDVCTEEMA